MDDQDRPGKAQAGAGTDEARRAATGRNRVHRRANRARSAVCAKVEHPFAAQKSRMGLFVVTIGVARATIKIGTANLTYNFRRLVWHERRAPFA